MFRKCTIGRDQYLLRKALYLVNTASGLNVFTIECTRDFG